MTGKEITEPGKPVSELTLEAFKRNETELTSFSYDGTDDAGRPVARLYPLPEVNRYTDLISEAECLAIIVELEEALQPALYDQARTLARAVVGRYPRRELIDPNVFIFELTRAFAEAPADLGQVAANSLRTSKFLPNVGDVIAALEPLVKERRRALDQARRHLAEHERRRAEQAGDGWTEDQRRKYEDETEAIRRHGRPRPLGCVLTDIKK